MNQLVSMIETDEGRSNAAYPDPLTHGAPWTIGVGHCGPEVREGLVWTDLQVDQTRDADIARAAEGCQANFPWFPQLNFARQAVLIGMAFQMGIGRAPTATEPGDGLLDFVHTLGAVRDERWADAEAGLLASDWAKQTPVRARRRAHQLATGEWQ